MIKVKVLYPWFDLHVTCVCVVMSNDVEGHLLKIEGVHLQKDH